MSAIKRAVQRVHYYAHNVARDIAPQALFRRNLQRVLEGIDRHGADRIAERLNYYNKMSRLYQTPADGSTVAGIPRAKSRYYYDLKEHARYFPRHLRIEHLFGDIVHIPDLPSIVKSRPISDANEHSVVMKLNKFRHYQLFDDGTDFDHKKPMAVWRGGGRNPKRVALVQRYHNHPLCDIGRTTRKVVDHTNKPFLSPAEQLKYRYIISIEGNDVATNLKWIMASQSLCLMPLSVYETWFMEGRLIAGLHFVQLRDDFADLEDKIMHYEKHPAEAREIIRNANAYVAQFADAPREKLLSLLVLYKYFALTGQIDPDPRIAALWNG